MGTRQCGRRLAEGCVYIDYKLVKANNLTKREDVVAEMEKVVLWKIQVVLIEPH